jgi:hypothetical protein
MIYHVITGENSHTIERYLKDWAPHLKPRSHVFRIEKLHEAERLPVSTYLFSDIERLSEERREILSQVYKQLEAHGARLLNNPRTSKDRYGLLKCLYEAGINTHRIFKIDELPSDLKFPVFVRVGNDHKGTMTHLLHSWTELENALLSAAFQGFVMSDLVVVEFADTRASSDEEYHRYYAYRLGDRIIPRGYSWSRNWQVKGRDVNPAWDAEERAAYLEEKPHQDQLMNMFKLAGIEWGRADYSVQNGKIRVWEINTSPTFAITGPDKYEEFRRVFHLRAAELLSEAFEAVDQPIARDRIPLKLNWNMQPQPA